MATAGGNSRLQQQLEEKISAFRGVQKEAQSCFERRQKYSQQLNESEMVLKELELLDDEANVYKLVGPALIKQDLVEAKSNVSKRVEYIQNEMKRIESNVKGIESKQSQMQEEILGLQQQLKSAQ
mmetsp:Transcript_560/g.3960  ORF Transcript_560/g.3960 Transcript_560/m.3960 type:complete len:125 (+) Transcript_560:75-449(+)